MVGALSPAAVFIDGTHIKASANLNKKIKQEVPVAAKRYREELLAEADACSFSAWQMAELCAVRDDPWA